MRYSGAPHFLDSTELLRFTVVSIICLYSYDDVVDELLLTDIDDVVALFLPNGVFNDSIFDDGAVVSGSNVADVNTDDDVNNAEDDDVNVAGVDSVVVDSDVEAEADGAGRDR